MSLFFGTRRMTVRLNRKGGCGFIPEKMTEMKLKALLGRRMRAKRPIMHNSEKHCRTPGRDMGSEGRTRRGRGFSPM